MAGEGCFITLEGGEGAGKSTQLPRLVAWLEGRGLEIVATREPGGTDGAEAIRTLLVDGPAARWLPSTELLLVAAARDDHLQRLILPALARGAWVVCDRYLDSTHVYQGIAGGVPAASIDRLHDEVMRVRRPDLTILLDLPVDLGFSRRGAGGRSGRFEAKGERFHAMVRAGFLELARREPRRFAVVDATRPVDETALAIREVVTGRLGHLP